jgi:hypothetical protein
MDAWLKQTVRLDPPGAQGGGEDEANYALAWFPHYLVTGSELARAHFESLLDLLEGWVQRDCFHGYELEAEAHHGTEPFLLFLPRFLGLFPDHERARSILADAAEHIGNWVEGIPAWFDWERNRFFGYEIGTRTVVRGGEQACELAEHFRFIHIALAAHRVLDDERYADWALTYGRRRAQMIVDVPDGPLPVMWGPEGQPLWEHDLNRAQVRMSAQSHRVAGDPTAGLEVLLASGAIYALGDLYGSSGDPVFKEAARRIVEPLIPWLHDPYADPGAAAIGYYRQAFADTSFDAEIVSMAQRMPGPDGGELAMFIPEAVRRELPGIGKRADMVLWGSMGSQMHGVTPTREPSSAALALAYHVTGDIGFAARGLDQAARKLKIARRGLRGGREHSDMGSAICSVAAGHGRNWGWGAVTGCYGPLILGTQLRRGAVTPSVWLRRQEGEEGLPESVLTLARPPCGAGGEVVLYNAGADAITLGCRTDQADESRIQFEPGGESRIVIPTRSAVC